MQGWFLSLKKKKKNILRSKLLSIPINSFVRNFFSVQRLSEYLKIYDFQITEVVAWKFNGSNTLQGEKKKRKGEKFYRICTINMEGLVFITDLKNWQSTRKNPLVFKESAIDWKKEGRNNSWPSFNDSSIIPLVNDFQILQEERNESPTLSRIESKTSSQHRLIIDPRNNVYR